MSDTISAIAGLVGTVVGGWLVARYQRGQQLLNSKRADDALMRDRAADVLTEVNAIASSVMPAMISIAKQLGSAELNPDIETIPMPSLDRLRVLLILYFPSALGIVDEHNSKISAISSQVGFGGPLDTERVDLGKVRARGMRMALALTEELPKTMAAVEKHIAAKVAEFRIGNDRIEPRSWWQRRLSTLLGHD